jgi:hypothetical protein
MPDAVPTITMFPKIKSSMALKTGVSELQPRLLDVTLGTIAQLSPTICFVRALQNL